MLSIVLAEDNLLVREGVRGVLSASADLQVVAVCVDATELRSAIEKYEPDVVVTDIHMPPGFSDEGIQVARELRRSRPKVGVVVLHHAVMEVARGGSVIDPQVVEKLVRTRSRPATSPLAGLTPRELDVLAEMAEGRANAAIAERLFLTVRGVEGHIRALFAKLGLAAEPDAHHRVRAVLLYLSEH